ncbi:Peroxisomal membrane protein 4 [Wickerhamomyces ciferrii]|uniref:Peroxisomal membrane protein 4 n=1 Tax=Wickerhamomyces ciferrii (strain ATCC 14091 / BCRC 22168 / CBS 111 / JCM 3599 / NBRC 0793 / NRRL Y-1031 F-60-10) TaxID=1206466 RepID=K0KTG7_WICCF|nr:Peroxisomal membrane protein 4 [Wickerhamomyces ciferrii]CCH46461.1 Peroxisomal membrane protein 4 [Wickerhamomyces ciferrii]
MSLDIDALIKNPAYRELFQIIKSMRNGAVYGGRLRFAHSLVIQLLFRRTVPLDKRLKLVFKQSKDHGLILASFALVYKVLMIALKQINGGAPINEFISGFISAMLVYGNRTTVFNHSIAHQITLYCSARVLLGLGKMLAYKIAKTLKEEKIFKDKKLIRGNIQTNTWTLFASVSWGLVMYLHRYYPSFLQHGLESSMVYIYDDFKWNDLRSLLGY